ncbi:MAG: ABC transporter permease [Clostridiales Family XIII bacterium]|jgi:hypothetical protein|nr:ABC transporter permease [Clostridiales Family XIII bacterium]
MKFLRLLLSDAKSALLRYPVILLFPVFVAVMVYLLLPKGLTEKGELPKLNVTVVNQDDAKNTALLVGLADNIELVDQFTEAETTEAAVAMLKAGETDLVVELPKKMLRNIIRGNEVTITVRAEDPLIGTVAEAVIGELANTLNGVQRTSMAYYDLSPLRFETKAEADEADEAFDETLIRAVIVRKANITVVRTATAYEIQLTALLIFLSAAMGAVYAAMAAARQYRDGLMRRLKMHRVALPLVWAEKCLLAVLVSLPLSLLLGLGALAVGFPVSVLHAALSAAALAVPLAAVFLLFAVSRKDAARPAHTMLAALTLCLLCLFLGGGFYPDFKMDVSLRLMNPAWLAHLLSEWSLAAGV